TKLSSVLELDKEEILEKIKEGQKEERFQVEFGKHGRNLSQEKMEEITDLDIPGVNFIEDSMRYYPNGTFASQILGFARETDEEEVQQDKDGDDIVLTMDQKIQTLLEDVLSQVNDQYQPKRITAVVMDPKTGEVLAMSNRPSYNPNKPNDVKNWYNDVISTPVEPGSTAKIFTWAAAIDSGVYDGDETFKSGKYSVNEKVETINDHNQGKGWGTIDYDEGFRRSSNVAASKLMWEKMEDDVFLDYLKKFD